MKLKQTVLIIAAIIGIGSFVVAPIASAAKCGGVTTSIISCPESGSKDPQNNGVWGLLILGINILTAGIAVAAVTGIIWGGFMYLTASDSADQVRKAKMILWNTTIGIVVYALMYSFLNFLIPGGLFN